MTDEHENRIGRGENAMNHTCVECGHVAPGGRGDWACHADADTTPVCRGRCFVAYNTRKQAGRAASIAKELRKSTIGEILRIADGAQERFGDFASMHEAYGVLEEERDELFDAVKLRQPHPTRAEKIRKEAIDVAAVALRIAEQASKVTR